mgnify:CR=1 FL=1
MPSDMFNTPPHRPARMESVQSFGLESVADEDDDYDHAAPLFALHATFDDDDDSLTPPPAPRASTADACPF